MLHVHNGDSTANTLKEFGFPGEHVAFREVLMAGPAQRGGSPDESRKVRAKFLAEAYQVELDDCQRDLLDQEAALRRFSEHEETILWFEHDLFCQINLIYLLDWFSTQSKGKSQLSLICIGELPGVEDFTGLGQLRGEELASLFDARHEVTEAELSLAGRAWAAYCSPNPEEIRRLLDEDTSAMPFLENALSLHLARFPSVRNGLGRVENKALELISNGPIGFKSLFPKFAKEQSGYGMGDAQLWCELKRLAKAIQPLITITGFRDVESAFTSSRFHEASFELTETGRAVLASKSDFVELNGIDLWLGGVHLIDNALWRWDERQLRLVNSA